LERVAGALDALPAVRDQAELLNKGLILAAHFEHADTVRAFLARLKKLLDHAHGPEAAQVFESLSAQCFRGMRKLGMREEIDRLLSQRASWALNGQELSALGRRDARELPTVLHTLLHVGAGRFYFGKDEAALSVLEAVKPLVFEGGLHPPELVELSIAY